MSIVEVNHDRAIVKLWGFMSSLSMHTLTEPLRQLPDFNKQLGSAPQVSYPLRTHFDIEVYLNIITKSLDGSLFAQAKHPDGCQLQRIHSCTEVAEKQLAYLQAAENLSENIEKSLLEGSMTDEFQFCLADHQHPCIFQYVKLYQNLGKERIYRTLGSKDGERCLAVVSLCKRIDELKEDPKTLLEQRKSLEETIIQIVKIVQDHYGECSTQLAKEKEDPKSRDIPFFSTHLHKLHDRFWDEEFVVQKITTWKEKQKIASESGIEELFTLRGRIYALRVIVNRQLLLARCLDGLAASIDALEELPNKADKTAYELLKNDLAVIQKCSKMARNHFNLTTEDEPLNLDLVPCLECLLAGSSQSHNRIGSESETKNERTKRT